MITIKLKGLAEKLNKTITDIARETGINRNTITALYHNKVDGIKFETITKICKQYGIEISELLQSEDGDMRAMDEVTWYRQEGEVVPFTGWTFMERITTDKYDIGGKLYTFGNGYCYFKNDYAWLYWETSTLNTLSGAIYERYKDPKEMTNYFNKYLKAASVLEKMYRDVDPMEILGMNKAEAIKYFAKIRDAYKVFWEPSLFIDAFDAGFDQKTIQSIADKYSLTVEEIGILTNPEKMTFNNERLLRVAELARAISSGINVKSVKELDKQFVKYGDEIKKYIKEFDYYKSNYSVIRHITETEAIEEITFYIGNPKKLTEIHDKLKNYESSQRAAVEKVLKKHKLNHNPLFFFNQLTYWREHRKKVNLMGIHILDMILFYIENETGISKKYLRFLSFDEFEGAVKGLAKKDVLQNRHDNGMIVCLYQRDYKILDGEEARSVKTDLDQNINKIANSTELRGQTASQGYAKGIAKVILDQKDFGKLKKGEILVTGMTRPEFVPIMEKAAAIVTNEGGITCHAAIVSRELGKPCVIGTKNATEVIKDGDLVEVRANHGTVKILKS